ncbi:Fc.00g047000.m01.CDS01 [Cosmosporella sp. VM-42]
MRYVLALLSLLSLANAQFGGFFDQMFNQQGGHQHQQQQQNNPSDAAHYRQRHDGSVCDNYLCPDTLACVHFPHHCPCAWDAHQEKFELADGHRICVSRGGFQEGEAARKIELARKGLL